MLSIVALCQIQTDTTKSVYQNLDTLIFYNVSLASGPAIDCNNFNFKIKQIKYFVDCKEVSEAVYLKYKNANDKIDKCTPCYAKTLDTNGRIINAGVKYTDCAVGIWIEYYINGKIKVIGHYKENNTGKWKNIWDKGYCSKKHGIWKYYDTNGQLINTELYKNGNLMK
jgi:antitoxin component YwqK of YwqJK toxin-antitoxin module